MSASKRTPGPWRASCRSVAYSDGEWPEDEFLQWEVEGPRYPTGRGDFFQADALLIAAAPELLEALQTLLPMLDEWHEAYPESVGDKELPARRLAHAAIMKATGESA